MSVISEGLVSMGDDFAPEELIEARRYKIVIYWSKEDQVFIAAMPELPGLLVHADSPEEAVKRAVFVAADVLRIARACGDEIPVPESMLVPIAS